ncbi:MAG: 30S ribosomal protein S9 [bacterium]|nr:30S ribosomal protein S9 [bacterium]
MTKEDVFVAVGRRKTSIARVRLMPGKGEILVNQKDILEYFKRETLKSLILKPFDLLELSGNYDVIVRVNGGGLSGQAGAMRLGISRALALVDEEYRVKLRKEKFLTRDARKVERKKYGQKGARKRFQFSKR